MQLRQLSHQLLCRLPRLIAAVRTLRLKAGDTAETFASAVELARELLKLQDPALETYLLHAVQVRKTLHHADAVSVPYSFHFPCYQHFESAVYFWQTRILLNSLTLRLRQLTPASSPPLDLSSSALAEQNLSYGINILMSFVFASEIGRLGNSCMFFAPFALWLVTKEHAGTEMRGKSVAMIRSLVLRRFSTLWGISFELSPARMDEAADMLVGGPIGGFLVDMFK